MSPSENQTDLDLVEMARQLGVILSAIEAVQLEAEPAEQAYIASVRDACDRLLGERDYS